MTFGAQVEEWREMVDDLTDEDKPTEAILAWMAEESGGNACATGIIRDGRNVEAGIGQQYFEEPDSTIGSITSAMLRSACGSDPHNQHATRDLTDEEKGWQVEALLADVDHSMKRAIQQLHAAGATWTDQEFWCLVKLQHGLPAVPAMLLGPCGKALGHAPYTWREFRKYVERLSVDELHHLAPPVARFAGELGRIFDNAERVGSALGELP